MIFNRIYLKKDVQSHYTDYTECGILGTIYDSDENHIWLKLLKCSMPYNDSKCGEAVFSIRGNYGCICKIMRMDIERNIRYEEDFYIKYNSVFEIDTSRNCIDELRRNIVVLNIRGILEAFQEKRITFKQAFIAIETYSFLFSEGFRNKRLTNMVEDMLEGKRKNIPIVGWNNQKNNDNKNTDEKEIVNKGRFEKLEYE